MNVVLLGATKGVGRALARLLVERGDRVFLLGRSVTEVERSRTDLQLRASAAMVAGGAHCDLLDTETFAPALEAAHRALGAIDVIVVTAAAFEPQDVLAVALDKTRDVLMCTFTNTILFCERARFLLRQRGGTLCVFSSVAGDRARKKNVLYGAAKAGLTHYLEGLDHAYRGDGLRIVCIKPGFIRTQMTAGLDPPPFATTPERVARDALHAIERGTPVLYTPRVIRLVALVIRLLPRAVVRRLEF